MEKRPAGSNTKGNLRITGSSTAAGGLYDKIKIVGEGTIDGDADCAQMKCVGTMEMDGSLHTGRASIVGTGTFSGAVQADLLKISGTAAIGQDARLRELHCSGALDIQGSLYGDRLHMRGELHTKGDCEAELLEVKGILEIDGMLNAGELILKLYRDCRAREIGGGKIRVRKASLLHPFSLFFRPYMHASLSAAVIEGDEIYLEHTKADIVRGNQVTIGPGCEIGLVEYKTRLEQNKNATIKQQRKV